METESKGALSMAIIGNTLNLGYNIPFVYLVWKNRSSKNISGIFLLLRFWGSISWLIYAVLVSDTWVGISYTVTLIATCMIYYIKITERRKNKDKSIEEKTKKPNITTSKPTLKITSV
jgi:uncharacterized protein with PQ loop repeat